MVCTPPGSIHAAAERQVAAAFLLCGRKGWNLPTYIAVAKTLDITPTYIALDRLAIDLALSAEIDILAAERLVDRG
jgi:hypothetical protein